MARRTNTAHKAIVNVSSTDHKTPEVPMMPDMSTEQMKNLGVEPEKIAEGQSPATEISKVDIGDLGLSNKSALIRFYASKGFKTGDIAKQMTALQVAAGGKPMKYQQVRNVLVQLAPQPKAS